MRILVTGSEGVLGRSLVEELRARGHSVWGVDAFHSGDPLTVRADIAVRHQLKRAFGMAEPHFVFHLAAEFGRLNGEEFTEQLWRTAMVGTRNVLELTKNAGAKLGFASSSEIYGDTEAEWLDEEITERQVMFHPNEYALSKWTNERQILSFQKRNPGFEATRLRFFNAYGPGERYHPYRSVIALFCHRALQGMPLPVFKGYERTFMYIDDFIPTLANVASAELKHSVYNIGGTDFRPVEEAAEIIREEVGSLTGQSVEIEFVGEDRHNIRSKRPDVRRACEDLGHDPRTILEDGIPATVAWYEREISSKQISRDNSELDASG